MTQTVNYQITTGRVLLNGLYIGKGYSGHGPGLNNPAEEGVKSEGPLPEGTYDIGGWIDDNGHLGPLISRLTPVNVPNLNGRGGFYIHGDNKLMNHSASDGCIVLDAGTRKTIMQSGAKTLTVTR